MDVNWAYLSLSFERDAAQLPPSSRLAIDSRVPSVLLLLGLRDDHAHVRTSQIHALTQMCAEAPLRSKARTGTRADSCHRCAALGRRLSKRDGRCS